MATSVDQKMLRQTKFPVEFNQKVDMQKVNVEVMKKWIAGKISEILGSEDDVVIELCFNLLEGSRFPNIKVLQIQLTGFLEKDTATFCKELWTLCLSAQSNPQGVPKELLEAKKLELIQEKIATEKAAEIARRRQEHERARDRELEQVRRREYLGRSERGRGRGRDVVAARGARGFETRAQRDSRSPPPGPRNSKDHRFPSARREVDTYIPPGGSRMQERHRRRSRSVSYSPPRSPSRTSPRRRQRRSRTRSSSRSVVPQKSRSQLSRRITEEERHKHWSSSERRNGENRSKDRGRPGSADRSISPSPRIHPHGKRSTSATSQSSTHSHRNRGKHDRQHRISRRRSESLSSQSPPPHRRWSRTRGETRRSLRNPIHDANAIADMRNDESNTQLHVHNQESHSSRNSSQSPKRNLKRHRSIERYDPRFKRRRNTSSAEPDDVNEEKSKPTVMRDDGE